MQAKEKADRAKKNFGAFGPQSFKSRSLQSFQKEMEKGKTGHLMSVFNAKEKIKAGKLRQEDIPYMQRGKPSAKPQATMECSPTNLSRFFVPSRRILGQQRCSHGQESSVERR